MEALTDGRTDTHSKFRIISSPLFVAGIKCITLTFLYSCEVLHFFFFFFFCHFLSVYNKKKKKNKTKNTTTSLCQIQQKEVLK